MTIELRFINWFIKKLIAVLVIVSLKIGHHLWTFHYGKNSKATMRRNLLKWCNLVSISKKLRFCVFGGVRIY